MKQDIIVKFLNSWIRTENTINTTEQIQEWVELLNETTYININDCSINVVKILLLYFYYSTFIHYCLVFQKLCFLYFLLFVSMFSH